MEIPRTPDIALAIRRTAAAAVLLLGGNAVLFDDHGSEAQAAAVAFGGVEVESISCPPSLRGVNLRNTAPDVRFIESYNSQTGATISGLTLGSGDDGRIGVSETVAGEDQPVNLRAKAQGGTIVGATQVIMDCLQNDPSTTTSNSITTTSVRITTTTGGPNTSTSTTASPNTSTTTTPVSSTQPKTTIISITNPAETTTTTVSSTQPKTTILSNTNPTTTITAPATPTEGRYLALAG